jgi:cell wall-associated NlpC family hydrolase
MTQHDFVRSMIGVPWRRWATGFDACDCYGLVVLYYRHVVGVEIGETPQTTLAGGIGMHLGRWIEIDKPEAGCCGFMAFRGSEPTHCGIYIGSGDLLHSDGNEDKPGSVRVSRLRTIEAIYGKVRFYALRDQ